MLGQLGRVLVGDAALHQVTSRRHADLTLVQERPPRPNGHGLFDVDVVQDDQRRVPTQLQVHPSSGARRRARPTARPARVDPVNEIIATFGSVTSASPTSAPPGSTLNTPRWHAGLLEHASQNDPAGYGGPGIGLQQHRVAERQRRPDRPDGQDQREVERGDHADHADRQAPGHAEHGIARAAAAGRTAARPARPTRSRCWPRTTSPVGPWEGWRPVSRTIQPWISSPCSVNRSPARRSTAARSWYGVAAQARWASRARRAARPTSSAFAVESTPSCSPVAGSMTADLRRCPAPSHR